MSHELGRSPQSNAAFFAAAQSALPETSSIVAHAGANCLLDVGQFRHTGIPLSEELHWLKELCGEVVQGGVYLLGGAPGGFKSGLALQLSLDLNRQGVRTLSILTEEPAGRLKERALRMTAQWPRADVHRALSHLHVAHQ